MWKVKNLVSKFFSPRYLFWTNVTLGGTFLAAADTVEQKIQRYISRHEEQAKEIDLRRSKVMAGGGLLFGAMGHFWYSFLDKHLHGNSRSIVFKKLACEAAAGPPFLFVIFTFVGLLEGKDFKEICNGFRQNLLFCCLADWGFYVPLQYLNFYYLPPKYRFLYVAVITLFYDTFLSFLLHRPLNQSAVTADQHSLQDRNKGS